MNTSSTARQLNDALSANEVLSKLQPSSKRRLASGVILHTLGKAKTICRQGAPAIRFWLVLDGEVKLQEHGTQGRELLIDLILPNELFGAVFYSDHPIYPCTAVAMKPTKLLSFRLRDLMDELEANSSVQKALLADTCHKLCQAQHMRGLLHEPALVRIAHLLLHLYARFGRVIPETRATIAEFAGISGETAIRITSALAKRGILATRRGQIEIRSVAGLHACAQDN
jgi:CRP-like cAMP-binding protein